MKIKNKTLQVVFEHDVVVGDGAITATFEHIIFVYENKEGNIDYDLEFSDVRNIKFMGVSIEDGYKGYEKFVKSMSEIGVDVVKLFDDAAAKAITSDHISQLKQMYIDGILLKRNSFSLTGSR